jgi:hypothetical protein
MAPSPSRDAENSVTNWLIFLATLHSSIASKTSSDWLMYCICMELLRVSNGSRARSDRKTNKPRAMYVVLWPLMQNVSASYILKIVYSPGSIGVMHAISPVENVDNIPRCTPTFICCCGKLLRSDKL